MQSKLQTAQNQFEAATGAGGAKADELMKLKEELPQLKDDLSKAKDGIPERQKEVEELIKKVCRLLVHLLQPNASRQAVVSTKPFC